MPAPIVVGIHLEKQPDGTWAERRTERWGRMAVADTPTGPVVVLFSTHEAPDNAAVEAIASILKAYQLGQRIEADAQTVTVARPVKQRPPRRIKEGGKTDE